MSEQDVVRLIYERLSKRFDIERIVLFGSRARGEAEEGSDYDVLVVARTDVPFIKRQGLALLALGKRDFAVDLLVYTPEEVKREDYYRRETVVGSFERRITLPPETTDDDIEARYDKGILEVTVHGGALPVPGYGEVYFRRRAAGIGRRVGHAPQVPDRARPAGFIS